MILTIDKLSASHFELQIPRKRYHIMPLVIVLQIFSLLACVSVSDQNNFFVSSILNMVVGCGAKSVKMCKKRIFQVSRGCVCIVACLLSQRRDSPRGALVMKNYCGCAPLNFRAYRQREIYAANAFDPVKICMWELRVRANHSEEQNPVFLSSCADRKFINTEVYLSL